VRLFQDLDPDQAAAFGQFEVGQTSPMIERQMRPGLRRIVMHLERLLVGADCKDEAGAESMRRA
jgi:hypothetical protein